MSNNNFKNNVNLLLARLGASMWLLKLKVLLFDVRLGFAGTLLLLGTLLTGCEHLPQRPCEQQPLPKPPALSEPIPSESYSSQWKRLAEEWRKKLDFTQTTPKN